jgi:signal transduction histidine kinase
VPIHRPTRSVIWRSLRTRLFLAHLLVLLIGVLTLLLASLAIGPDLHDSLMDAMVGPYAKIVLDVENMDEMEQRVSEAFQTALLDVLIIGACAAVATAIASSLFVSARIVRVLQRVLDASERIASGHYAERLPPGDITELDTLSRQFNTMAAALDEAEQRRVALIGDVAHELRTPLATMESYTEGLLDGVIAATDETWGVLNDEVGRMRRLVEDLQMLSRAEAHQIPLALAPIVPHDLVARAIARLEPQYADKRVTLVSNLPAHLPPVQADADRIVQVFINVLGNALRATPVGGSVQVWAEHRPGAIVFHVVDTGLGIAPEHLPHLFERFYRVDKARSRAIGGSGIGLAIARALVEAHGGHIWATSDGPDRGATFSFSLPSIS